MKRNFFTIAFAVVLAGMSSTAFANYQQHQTTTHRTPKWVSEMGFWVVETNIHTPKHNIVYFYNNDKVLVYKETIDGFVLKLNKRRTKMRLKKLVDQTVGTYAQQQKAAENEMLVMNVMR